MAIITDVKALGEDLKDGQEFQVTIDDITMTFRPVRTCPAVSKDVYGHKRVCRGVWYDYAGSRYPDGIMYRFCPKTTDALGVLNSLLWEGIKRSGEHGRLERQKQEEASTKRRRMDAALSLLEACEEVAQTTTYGDTQYRAYRGAVHTALFKLKES